MTAMLIINTTGRGLSTSVGDVTRAEGGLVVRHALELPGLATLTEGRGWDNPFFTDLPVLLMGNGYRAESSAGFVSVKEGCYAHPSLGWVVGYMGSDRSLRPIRPVSAHMFVRGRLVADRTHGNSSPTTAGAAYSGLDILLKADQRAVVIAEGQSDYTSVYRLLPEHPMPRSQRWQGETSKNFEGFDNEALDEEHRAERFTRKAVLEAAGRAVMTKGLREQLYSPDGMALHRMTEVRAELYPRMGDEDFEAVVLEVIGATRSPYTEHLPSATVQEAGSSE